MGKLTLVISVISLFVALGCSSGSAKNNPMLPDLKTVSSETGSSRVLWGIWHVTIQPTGIDTGNIEIVPLRGPMFNANVQKFLSPPVSPVSLISIKLLSGSDLTKGYLNIDLGLKHPFPGLNQFRGFDVRGIFMADALKAGLHDPGLIYTEPPISGGPAGTPYMLNPDGYTRWWNATEFTDPAPLFSYKPGKVGNLPNPSATLNPYKYFADELGLDDDVAKLNPQNRGTFSPTGNANHRRYQIQFPVGQIKFNYAIDASWFTPDPAYKPDYPIESFPSSAQMQEAYIISVSDDGTDAYFTSTSSGGDVKLKIEVFDWQAPKNPVGAIGEVWGIWLEGYPLGSPTEISQLAKVQPGSGSTSSVWQIDLNGMMLNLDKSGTFTLLGTVESMSPTRYQPQLDGGENFIYPPYAWLSSYFLATVTVSDKAPVSFALTSPNGGEQWALGTGHDITWTGGVGVQKVMLQYSKDDFVSDIHMIAPMIDNTGTFPWTLPADPSDTVKVRVSDAGNLASYDDSDNYFSITTGPKNPQLIASLHYFHSPYMVRVDTQKNDAWVDCTEAAPVLDFGFYRIDNNEVVEKVFEKVPGGGIFGGMPGAYGLNVAGRKIVSQDCFAMSTAGPVDLWDLDGGPAQKFYVPLEPGYPEIILAPDCDLFSDLSIAVVADTATKPNGRLIAWDYSNPSPTYSIHWTNELPDVVEPDYAGHRLFVMCRGDFGGPGPTVEVWNVEDWSIITTFPTDTGVFPFMTDMRYDPIHKRLYFGSDDNKFEVWDTETYTHIQTVDCPTGVVRGIDVMGDAIYVTAGAELLVFDATSFEQLWDVPAGSEPEALSCNPNTGKIYVPDMSGGNVLVFQG